ncbi:hypothetical protein OA493_02005 [Gammaproteobacteria bacterium]|jgi:hypothetical protein|nr:hypothetical protein [Gammaproteobacteria bacterium]
MLNFYMTEYEVDGKIKDGPIIMARSLEVANIQAKELKLKLVGEMFPYMDITGYEEREIH